MSINLLGERSILSTFPLDTVNEVINLRVSRNPLTLIQPPIFAIESPPNILNMKIEKKNLCLFRKKYLKMLIIKRKCLYT